MSKKVLIISTSLRNNSNSDRLAGEFGRGAQEAGNEVEKISLIGKTIKFCHGCQACRKTHACVIKDDANEIVRKMAQADVLVFSTPIYYYEMSGQMKTLLDRVHPLYQTDCQFRDIYLLTSATEDGEGTPEGAIHGLKRWISCFPKARFAGIVFAGGVPMPGDISHHKSLTLAYEMGKKC
jgi:multimeric flavodoxin WrbA